MVLIKNTYTVIFGPNNAGNIYGLISNVPELCNPLRTKLAIVYITGINAKSLIA